mmetsp:Transcript_23968/g.41944  ORF Transcript_23968/g.41944 Transcript_23968/m.41944 type:complete len:239 (+) Transcript_23968:533-1249(+)
MFGFMPYTETIAYAIFVTLSRSSEAPVEILPTKSSSAARPARATAILSWMASCGNSMISSGKYCAKPSAPLLRGTIETFNNGSAYWRNQPANAWPDSCMATTFRSFSPIRLFSFTSPPMTRSVARSKSTISTPLALRRAAKIAASLQMLAMSAPAKPGVSADILFAMLSLSRVSVIMIGFRCTMKICCRSFKSGLSIAICRSKRPGLLSASSRMSARFVPAKTTTPVLLENPSISTSS